MRLMFGLLFTVALLFGEGFTVTSKNFSGQLGNALVFKGFGCKGENISPDIAWSNAPKETKSFAVTLYDPDAPTGSGWWHWVVVDIPASQNALATGAGALGGAALPKGALAIKTDFGSAAFGGACPPVGDSAHRYILTVHALDVEKLGVDATASAALTGFMLNAHTLAKSSIIAYYGR